MYDTDDGDGEDFERIIDGVAYPVLASSDQKTIALKGEVNTRRMLKFLRVRVRWNAWAEHREISEDGGPWTRMTDGHWDSLITRVHNPEYDFPIFKEDFARAVRALARRVSVDPMVEYLNGLADAQPTDVPGHDSGLTLETWLPAIAAIEDTAYHRAVGRYLIGAMVRRIMMPGCTSDEMPVLISRTQGIGKSSLAKLIAPDIDGRPAYTDSLSLGADSKIILEQTAGVAVVEFAELVAHRGKGMRNIKSMLSMTEDVARMAYDRETTRRLRRFIMIGTSNDEKPLRDPSGNRRFLPIRMRDDVEIDLPRFAASREWLWRQAVVEMRDSGMYETFRLPRDLWEAAMQAQDAARVRSPAEKLLAEMLGDEATGAMDWVTARDITLWRIRHGMHHDALFSDLMRDLGFASKTRVLSGARVRGWYRSGRAGDHGATNFIYDHRTGEIVRVAVGSGNNIST